MKTKSKIVFAILCNRASPVKSERFTPFVQPRWRSDLKLAQILSWRPGAYLRASGQLFGWLLLKALAQAATAFLLARYLGAEGYGLFVAVLAVNSFFSPLAGLGLHGVLLCDGARTPPDKLPTLISEVAVLWWPSALVFSVAAFLVALWTLPSSLPTGLLAIFSLSEVVSTSFIELIGRLEQSQHRMKEYGALGAGLVLSRLAGLCILVVFFEIEPVTWVAVYATTGLMYTGFIGFRTWRRYQLKATTSRNWSLISKGFPFAVGLVSLRLQSEFNKPVLAQYAYSMSGNFSAAQRLIDLACLPLNAMQEALWPKFYKTDDAPKKAKAIVCFLFVAAVATGLLIVLVAPAVPYFLGKSFGATSSLLMFLAGLPALQVLRNVMNAGVIARNRQSLFIWVYLAGGISSIMFNALLVPRFSLKGAIGSAYLTEMLSIVVLSLCIYLTNHHRRRNA